MRTRGWLHKWGSHDTIQAEQKDALRELIVLDAPGRDASPAMRLALQVRPRYGCAMPPNEFGF